MALAGGDGKRGFLMKTEAAIVDVMASGISTGSKVTGIERGLDKVADVFLGCLVGLAVSALMSRVWLIRQPRTP